MKKLSIRTVIFLLAFSYLNSLKAQGTAKDSIYRFTLKQAQDFAIQHNYNNKNAVLGMESARKKIWETTAIGLPQIGGSVQYQDMVDIPTQLIPDFLSPAIYGVLAQAGVVNPASIPNTSDQYLPMKFGTKYNMSYGISATQLLFSGAYLVGLKASKTYFELARLLSAKSEIDTRDNIAQAYHMIVITRQNRNALQASLEDLKKLLDETKEIYKKGFTEETSIDQLQISVTNLQNAVNLYDRINETGYNLLKYQLGLDLQAKVELLDTFDILVNMINPAIAGQELKLENNTDYQLLGTQEKLSLLNLKREQSAYLPTLATYFSYQEKAMRNDFDFFSTNNKFLQFNKTDDWFPTSVFGVNLDVPIWSSGMRHARVQQAKIELLKTKNNKEQLSLALRMAVQQAKNEYLNASEKMMTEKDNIALAKKIYDRTLIKFNQGMATSMELTQAHTQYISAQGNYFTSVQEVLNTQSKLNKILNNN